MSTAALIGLAAAFLTTGAFLPQAVLVLRTRQTAGISLTMYAMFVSGVACWTAYGLMIGSVPVILANAVTFLLAATVLALKLAAVLRPPRG